MSKISEEELSFGGLAEKVAATIGANFYRDDDRAVMSRLFREYREAAPVDAKAWLETRLVEIFPCVSKRPVWIEQSAIWPIHDGVPMLFVGQLDAETCEGFFDRSCLYVFCRKECEGDSGKWPLEYEVVEQFSDMP